MAKADAFIISVKVAILKFKNISDVLLNKMNK